MRRFRSAFSHRLQSRSMSQPVPVFVTAIRLLTFRASREELVTLGSSHLAFGLIATWIVGMGRWWDDPEALLFQHLGLGSVAYVFVLAFVLWALVKPLGPQDWTYRGVLTFVALTSPPALLYAIPVERFLDLDTARQVNVWFLAFVATWRLGLLVFYLRRLARLPWLSLIVASLLPLTIIVTALTALNLERAVFDVMSGLRDDGTSGDQAYGVLIGLTFLSTLLVAPLLLAYVLIWFGRRRATRHRIQS